MKAAYFDYAATTPVDPRVVREMLRYFEAEGIFGNPSSIHHPYGTEAAAAVELARKRVARLIEANATEIVWTSGATEANNLAIRGVLQSGPKAPRRLITVTTEHPSVLDTAKAVRKQGVEVDVLPVGRDGLIDLDRLDQALQKGKALVSVMWVNNETGVAQPMAEISKLCRRHGALLHTDATQAAGKIRVSVKKPAVDLMSLSAHKAYGPMGVGVLFARNRVPIRPMVSGGGQQKNLRPGTLPVPLIAGMGMAFDLLWRESDKLAKQAAVWRSRLDAVVEELGGRVNGSGTACVPQILNVGFEGLGGQLIPAMKRVAVSSGSACATGKTSISHVLRGMGVKRELALNALRISTGRYTTGREVEVLEQELRRAVSKLRV